MDKKELFLKTMFACSASDGRIAPEEVALIRKKASEEHLFEGLDVEQLLNQWVGQINARGLGFLRSYLSDVAAAELAQDDALAVVHLAIEMIEADRIIHYKEIKFFKKIRLRLRLTDEQILALHPDKADWLLPDIKANEELEWGDSKFEQIDLKS